MLRPGPGTPAEEVARNQRERLFGAMVACVSAIGYQSTRVTDLVELSGVSRRSFYDLFPDKAACFRAMLEQMLAEGTKRAFATENEGLSWEERTVNRFQAFATLVAEQPAAARICLVEASAAGPDVLEPVEDAIATLERTTGERFAESPEREGIPPELIVAFIGGTFRLARYSLYRGTQAELPGLIPKLMDFLLSYRTPPEPLRLATRPPTPAPETIDAHDHRERALRAFAVVVSEQGYSATRVNQVVKRASMSPTTFYSIFDGKEDLMIAAIESAAAQTTAAVLPAFRRSPDWAQGVRAAFGALFSFLASRPSLARLMVVEAYGAGQNVVQRRDENLRPLEVILAEGRSRMPDIEPLLLEAIIGGVYRLAYRQIQKSGPESLPELAPVCTYFTLAPFIGAEEACAAANGDGRAKGGRSFDDDSYRQLVAQTAKILHERESSVEDISRQIDAPVERIRRIFEELSAAELIEVADAEESGDRAPYRTNSVLLEDDAWERLSLAQRQEVSTAISHLIVAEIDRAIEAGIFDARVDRHLTHTPVRVDERGWRELMEIHDTAFRASVEVRERSAERLKRSGGVGIEGRSVQIMFETREPWD